MLPFFGSLQFLTPWFLGAALLTPALIYAYRQKTPRRKSVVSSIVVLKLLRKRDAPKTRFKPPLRFFLELLALLLLCAAAAMPISLDEGHRFALLIDNTLSMRAFDATSSLPATRLERARAAARKWLGEHEQNASVDVFESSPKLSRVDAENQSTATANDSVEKIKATASGDNLEAAISELAEGGKYERVIVVSDKLAEYTDSKTAGDNLFSDEKIAKTRTRVVGVNVGEAVSNVFVSGFSFLPDPLSEGNGKLIATVGYSGLNTAEAELTFWELAEGEKLLDKKTLHLSSDDAPEVSLELPKTTSKNSLFRVEVRSLRGQAGGKEDSIIEDNVGWLVPNASAGERILLVAGENVLAHSGLKTISAFTMEEVTPEQFAQRELDNYKLIIFHRAAPSVIPQKPTLLILPPEGNAIFPAQFIEQDSQVSSWLSEHPITSYLKVPLLKVSNGEIFNVPLWAQGVVRIEQGAIVVAGESHGIRVAAVGMELLPFEGMKTPVASVLTLNLLNWLTGGAELTGSNLTGSAVSLDASKSWTVRKPKGKEEHVKGPLKLDAPGLYFLSASTGERKQVAANAFFPSESNTLVKTQYSAPAVVEHERKLDEGAKLWWSTLIALAFGILMLEQLLFFLPERRKSS